MRFKLALIGHSVLNIAGALIIWIGAIFLVLPLGVEPKTLFLLREATLPICPRGHCLVDDAGIEPATSWMSTKYSTAEIIIRNLVEPRGFEPRSRP